METPLDMATVTSIVAIRTRHRSDLSKTLGLRDWRAVGGCFLVASNVSSRFGWGQEGGCYVLLDGSHAGHEWNRLPDGRIIDTTADQFGESSPGIRIATAADARYIRDCYCSV